MHKSEPTDPIPETFTGYEEAAEFWDSHDTTDYPDAFRTIEVVSEFRQRSYEIEIDADVIATLRTHARRKGISPTHLANDLLRRQLTSIK
jgi:hypothetical protein